MSAMSSKTMLPIYHHWCCHTQTCYSRRKRHHAYQCHCSVGLSHNIIERNSSPKCSCYNLFGLHAHYQNVCLVRVRVLAGEFWGGRIPAHERTSLVPPGKPIHAEARSLKTEMPSTVACLGMVGACLRSLFNNAKYYCLMLSCLKASPYQHTKHIKKHLSYRLQTLFGIVSA